MRTFALDLRSIALLRLGIAALILWDLADRAVFLRAHYTDNGIYPRAALALDQGRVQWSLHLATGSVAGQSVLFLVAAACGIMLLFGWHTRVAAVASWILLVSLQNRTPAVCYGADALLRALLLFALFLPIDARFSLDAKAARAAARPDAHFSAAAVAITVQIAAVYVFTGLLKLPDATWKNGTALYFACNADHHATYFGHFVGRSFALTRWLTYATLVIELALPFGLFIPLARDRVRVVLVVVFVGFHAASAACLHLGYFPGVSALAWLVFLPASIWERLGSATRAGLDLPRGARHAVVSGAVAVLALVVVASNLVSALPGAQLPPLADRVARAVSMQQRWIMFIHPMHDGWFVAPATLASGRQIDAFKNGAPVTWEKPAHVADQFPNMRWRKYLTDLTLERRRARENRALFARSICDDWNDGISDLGERMLAVDIVFMQQDDRIDGTETPVLRRVLVHRDCIAPDAPVEGADTGPPADDSAAFFDRKPAP